MERRKSGQEVEGKSGAGEAVPQAAERLEVCGVLAIGGGRIFEQEGSVFEGKGGREGMRQGGFWGAGSIKSWKKGGFFGLSPERG